MNSLVAVSLSSQHLARTLSAACQTWYSSKKYQCYPQFAPLFHKLVNGNAHLFGERLLYFVHISTHLASLIYSTNQMMLIVIYHMVTFWKVLIASLILCLWTRFSECVGTTVVSDNCLSLLPQYMPTALFSSLSHKYSLPTGVW